MERKSCTKDKICARIAEMPFKCRQAIKSGRKGIKSELW